MGSRACPRPDAAPLRDQLRDNERGALDALKIDRLVEAMALAGMGKTTLIRSIMGLATPQVREGTIQFENQDLRVLRPHAIARRKIALVSQGRRLFASLTVTEHLTMLKPASATDGWNLTRVFDTFPRLAERRHHRGSQLSGGERQMLAVGRALLLDPTLILMDEPSEGLAPVMVQHLETVIAALRNDGLGILLVEQNLYSALAVADRVFVMETGQIVYEGAKRDIEADATSLRHYLGVH